MKNLKIIVLSLVIIFFSFVVQANTMSDDNFTRLVYSGLKNIEQLYLVNVNVQGNENIFENGKSMGILTDNDEMIYNQNYKSKKLSDYLKLKIKNNMTDINIMTKKEYDNWLANIGDYSNKEKNKLGRFFIRVWLIGDSYPVVYHVRATFGSFTNVDIWSQEYLGYTNSSNIEKVTKDLIIKLVEEASITYLKVIGEM
ncbi:MAG: hypothetical protein ACOCV1_06945 [Bacillota bacterium]